MDDDWAAPWAPVIERIGTDLTTGEWILGADRIERSAIRRYLEPLEFDCPLHYDPGVAHQHGFTDLLAPYTSVITFTLPPMWQPGQQLFTDDARNAQPASTPIDAKDLGIPPEATGLIVADMEMDFVRPPIMGDWLSRRGNMLKSCVPKWTSVGRGAFMTLESEVVTEAGEVIARIRNTIFAYQPMAPQIVGDDKSDQRS